MPKKNKNKNKFKVQWFRDQKNFVLLLQLKSCPQWNIIVKSLTIKNHDHTSTRVRLEKQVGAPQESGFGIGLG